MTLTSSTTKVSYAGNGSTTVFAVGFRFLVNSHVQAILRDATGTETIWVEGTQYTLEGAGEAAGGTLTVDVSPVDYTPANGETLVIRRSVPETQETDYGENDSFPAETHEQALDKLTMIAQQLKENIGRAVTVPLTDVQQMIELPIDSTRVSKFLAFDAAGLPIAAAGTSADLTPVSAFMDALLDDADAATARAALDAVGLTGQEMIAGNKTFSGISTFSGQERLKKGANIASAATLVIGTDGNFFDVTGSTGPITAIDVVGGTAFWLRFLSTLTINHNGTSLVLPGDDNRTVAAGDVWECFAVGANQVLVVNILRANGFPLKQAVMGWAYTFTTSEQTGTTLIPDDDTIPQNTEGNEVRTLNYTPARSDSTLFVKSWWTGGHSVDTAEVWMCLFKDTDADAKRSAGMGSLLRTGATQSGHVFHQATGHSAGVQETWKLRVGSVSVGTTYTNRNSSGDRGGGSFSSGLEIMEMVA